MPLNPETLELTHSTESGAIHISCACFSLFPTFRNYPGFDQLNARSSDKKPAEHCLGRTLSLSYPVFVERRLCRTPSSSNPFCRTPSVEPRLFNPVPVEPGLCRTPSLSNPVSVEPRLSRTPSLFNPVFVEPGLCPIWISLLVEINE